MFAPPRKMKPPKWFQGIWIFLAPENMQEQYIIQLVFFKKSAKISTISLPVPFAIWLKRTWFQQTSEPSPCWVKLAGWGLEDLFFSSTCLVFKGFGRETQNPCIPCLPKRVSTGRTVCTHCIPSNTTAILQNLSKVCNWWSSTQNYKSLVKHQVF